MTAEIAVINKYAIALAADSAVTISDGNLHQKIYDSADKIFELSRVNPVGIMIFSGANLADIPLPILISKFRETCKPVQYVSQIAEEFLKFLQLQGDNATETTLDRELRRLLKPVLENILSSINERFLSILNENSFEGDEGEFVNELNKCRTEILERFLKSFKSMEDAEFLDDKKLEFDDKDTGKIEDVCADSFGGFTEDQRKIAVEISKLALMKRNPLGPVVGMVISGFGEKELFPTLVSFSIGGLPFGRLKFERSDKVDIDRDGVSARVMPFAQKEMVDRFLYGLDPEIERQVVQILKQIVPPIGDSLIEELEIDTDDAKDLRRLLRDAEDTAFRELQTNHLPSLRAQSQEDIESMVEFMPKPELANMAEALVNLTSVKRRVSKGLETVGGPIDVAVISRSEGFIWVKRKHYFSQELNLRYAERVRSRSTATGA